MLRLSVFIILICSIGVNAFAQPGAGTATFSNQTIAVKSQSPNTDAFVYYAPPSTVGADGGYGYRFVVNGTSASATNQIRINYTIYNQNDALVSFDRNNTAPTISAVYIMSSTHGAAGTAANASSTTLPSSNAAGKFRMYAIDLQAVNGTPSVLVQAYLNGATVGAAVPVTLSTTTKTQVNLSTNTSFYNIDAISITPSAGAVNIAAFAYGIRADNITSTAVTATTIAPSSITDVNASTNTVVENAAVGTTVGITAYASDPSAATGANLALNKQTYYSAIEAPGYNSSFAVDGDLTTRWSSAATNTEWMTVDLGAVYDVSRVKISWETAYGTAFKIQTSLAQNGAYSDLKSVTGNALLANDYVGLGGLTNSIGQFVRVQGVTRATTFGFSIWELEIYGSNITYSLTSNPGGKFAINAATGVVTVAGTLDYETATSYNITVQASNGLATSAQSFTINVTDVNDVSPVITSNGGASTASVTLPIGYTDATTVTATDGDGTSPNNTITTYSITGGAQATSFSIDAATGVLTFNTPPTAGTYIVTVAAGDGGTPQLTGSQTITFTIAGVGTYAFNKKITLNNTSLGISTNLTNFPVLLSIQSNDLIISNTCTDKVFNYTGTNPNYDFAFTDYAGSSEYNYQVESYNQTTGTLLVWVKIPTLTFATNNTLLFHYGASTPSTTHNTAFYAATWPADYQTVYHLNEGSAAAAVLNSTAAANNATQSNTAVATGKIGGAYTFNGTSSVITSAANVGLTTAFTLSAWVYLNSPVPTDQKVMTNEALNSGAKLSIYSSKVEVEARNGVGTYTNRATAGGTALAASNWYYVQAVYNGTNQISYVNGTAERATAQPASAGTAAPVVIGREYGFNTYFFNGIIDEARISNVAKSADWLKAEYINQNNPVAFTIVSVARGVNVANAANLPGALVYTWKGTNSTSTTDAGNWTNTTASIDNQLPPNANVSVIVPSGLTNYPALTISAGVYGLTLTNGASINLNGNTLTVGCNIYNSLGGKILYSGNNASGITWNGTTAQTYNGTNTVATAQTGNLTVNSGSTVTINGGPIDVYNALTIPGSLTVSASPAALILKSTATGSAYVPAITGTLTGDVSVERYITGGSANSRGYRLLSSPVSVSAGSLITPNLSYISAQLTPATGAYTTGTGGTGNGFNAGGNPTFYFYRESTPPSNASFTSGNYRGVGKINAGSSFTIDVDGGPKTLPAGNGFLFYFRGGPTTTPSPPTNASVIAQTATFVATGYLNRGTIAVSHWYTGAAGLLYTSVIANAAVRGMNLVGNPYPSAIDWDTYTNGGITSSNISSTIWVYNGNTKAYTTYVAGLSGVGTNSTGYADIIASGQGFFVRATGASPTLTFTENAKSTIQIPAANLTMATAPVAVPAQLQYLRLAVIKDSLEKEDALVFFKNDAKPEYILNEDAEYLKGNTAVNISTQSSDKLALAINQTALPRTGTSVIGVNVNVSGSGLYQLNLTETKNISMQYDIWLKDAYKKDSLDIKHNPTYNFNVNSADAASFGSNRFSLVIRQNPGYAYRLLDFSGIKSAREVQLNWKTENENALYFTVERSVDGGKTFEILASVPNKYNGNYTLLDKSPFKGLNIYRLKQEDNGTVTYSKQVNIKYNPTSVVANVIGVYPNPVTSNLNIVINKTINEAYYITITNAAGKIMKDAVTSQNEWNSNISNLIPGTYFINVINNKDKTYIGRSSFIKL